MNQLKKEHPIIISASRRTDLPAFYTDWLISIFKKGCMIWKNPFNPSQKKEIYLNKTRLIVFWSKNPTLLADNLDLFNKKGIHYYFQFTLNPYPEYLEPNLPALDKRIDLFKKIVDKSGMKNVIWRFDPIFLSKDIDENYIYDSILSIGKKLDGYAEQMVISFVQLYSKVKKKLKKAGIICSEITNDKKINILKKIGRINKQLNLEITSCAEPLNMNNELESIGIKKGSCIGPDIIKRLFSQDKILPGHIEKVKKDKGQRKECGCIRSIDIGSYNTCSHNCIYCYAKS